MHVIPALHVPLALTPPNEVHTHLEYTPFL